MVARVGRAGRLLRAPAGHRKCDQKYASHPAGRWCCAGSSISGVCASSVSPSVGPKPENSRFCGIGGQFYHSAEPKTNRPNRTLYNTKAKNLSILWSRVFRLRNQRMKVPRRALFALASTNAAFTLLRALFVAGHGVMVFCRLVVSQRTSFPPLSAHTS